MRKMLCIYDVNIPLEIMKEMDILKEKGISIQYELDETLADDISQITERMHLLEQKGVGAAPICKSLIENCEGKEILVVHCATINKEILDKCKDLKILGVLRGGLDNIDIEEVEKRGIKLIHAPWRSANAVADFTIGMMLAEDKNISRGHHYLRNGVWKRDYINDSYIRDLNKCVVGIVGFGNIGVRVAQRLKGFGSDIIVHDPFVNDEKIEELGYRAVSKDELFKLSDIVTLHLRQTKDTMNFVGEKELKLMKKQAYIINTARSGILNTEALLNALETKQIGGAAIDVFDQEPLPEDSKFLKLENVTITPHIAGYSSDTVINSVEIVLSDLLANEEGKAMVNVYKKIK